MRHMLWLLLLLWPVAARSESTCGSLELRKVSDFQQLRNCSIVVGHVRIAHLQLPGDANLTQLRSEVTEITDYLMIYRCSGLLTLESIFPKLRLIRGRKQLFDQYALTVYENRDLRELGLVALVRIQDGYIRVESNPMLCFVQTVDWIYLLGKPATQHFSIKLNKSPNHCPVCGGLSADYSYRSNLTRHCWNTQAAQLRFKPPRTEDCPEKCGRNGCDASGKCCEPSCITGCSAENCSLCGNYQRNGRCVDQCIVSYELHKRLCISDKECRQLKLIPLTRGYRCVDHCPDNHRPVNDSHGMPQCQLECRGLFHVKRQADLEPLQDCVTLNGSLIIELVDIKEKIVSALEQTLGSIKEITGYLKVLHSAQLMSLTFLKNLDTIRGDQLIENKYALFVVNNYYMEHIWPANRQVAIQRGTVFFHLNPRLCYEKILKLQSSLKSVRKISIADVSPNSNGERVICGDAVRTLNATVEDVNATAVRIAVDFMKCEDMETLIGYSYHYMEAPQGNITMYDGRHGCGHDDWLMDVSPSKNRRHVISNLKPYTRYAYFVKTLTRTDYHMQVDAYSKIMYFHTLASKPSPVSRLHGNSDHSTQIMVYWWPPRRPNGVISKYFVSFEPHNLTEPEASNKNYATFKACNSCDLDCVCNDLVPYDSGPQPEDESYYNKEQITYEDALPNLIYVSRKMKMKKEKFNKVKDFEDLIAAPSPVAAADSTSTTAPETNSADNSSTTSAGNYSAAAEEASKQYEIYRQYVEQRMRQVQDTGIDDFLISHPMPKCNDANASVSYQLEQKCVVEEQPKGTSVPGTQYYYKLTNLHPDQYYRILVRACVDGVINGCSNPTEMILKTISVQVEQFMNGQ
ncbi:insulin-like growth factor 1 receptor [Drosophila montana]|uniref:insulin-like growth factor 1 receptor n=1 Tax=Drosophila montana TaxID=40370 RepID=UPI00313DA285